MKHTSLLIAATGLASLVASTQAFAHAFLNHAEPGVGTIVNASPPELQLTFTEDIVAAFSGCMLRPRAAPQCRPERLSSGRPTRCTRVSPTALKPGTYVVSWHVVSVDTHHTQGTYKFTIAP